MKFAVCECGARIIVVPDLRAMAKTVYIHAAIHKMFETNPDKAEAERSRIENELKTKIIKELIGASASLPTISKHKSQSIQTRKSRLQW